MTTTKKGLRKPKLSCFVSAPFGCNIEVVVNILNEAGVQTRRADIFTSGEPTFEAIRKSIVSADFACVFLTGAENSQNQLFELGAAFGAGIPSVVLLDAEARLPSDLRGVMYARVSLSKPETVRTAVNGFLRTLKRGERLSPVARKGRERKINRSRALLEYETLRKSAGPERTFAFERFVASLFEKANINVVLEPSQTDRGVDLALWLDDVDQIIGNPILVELKFRTTIESWKEASNKMQKFLQIGQSPCGLIISGDKLPPTVPPVLSSMPLVMFFSIDDIIKLLAGGKLGSELIRRRNLAVHGMVG